MGDMRKDYVLERNVIVHPTAKKNTVTKKLILKYLMIIKRLLLKK